MIICLNNSSYKSKEEEKDCEEEMDDVKRELENLRREMKNQDKMGEIHKHEVVIEVQTIQ